jgi:hypothetical protein
MFGSVRRQRAQRRLTRLNAFLAQVHRDKAALHQEVLSPVILAPEQMGSRIGLAVSFWPLQEVHEADFLLGERPEPPGPAPEYDALDIIEPIVPLAYKLLGYRELAPWGQVGNLNTPEVQAINAFGLYGPALAHDASDVGVSSLDIPAGIAQQPPATMQTGSKWSSSTGGRAPHVTAWGYDQHARIRPEELPLHSASAADSSGNTVSSVAKQPQLGQSWRRRQRISVPAFEHTSPTLPQQPHVRPL